MTEGLGRKGLAGMWVLWEDREQPGCFGVLEQFPGALGLVLSLHSLIFVLIFTELRDRFGIGVSPLCSTG